MHRAAFLPVTWAIGLALGTWTADLQAAGPVLENVRSETNEVGLYEKFELRIDLRARYSNPFDPDELDLWAEFTSPSGKSFRIWGFYNPSSWSSLWMIRFAPTELGKWKYVVHLRDLDGNTQSDERTFSAVASPHHGFLTIAPNGRYLQYSDGSAYYGIGFWYNDSFEQYGQGNIAEDELDDLQSLGVNFIAFFPTPLETMGTGLGRYDQNRCGRMDQLFEWCETRGMHISWNLWFHSYISEAVWGGGNARYRNNPYRLVTSPRDFFGSEQAWKYQEKLYRYIIARWGYSRALFLWFVIDEINGTEGWLEGDKKVAEGWCESVDRFFNTHDPYGRPTTGTQSGGIDQWWPNGYKIFDIAGREIYEAQGHPMPKSGKADLNTENPLQYSYRNYARQLQNLWSEFSKPVLIGECGWDHTYYEPEMPGYLAMYHNALWVSLVNGACTTPFWWAHSNRLNDNLITNQLRSFAQFVADIDFAHLEFRPAVIDAGQCDGWALQSDQLVFGWVVNPRIGVANEQFTIAGLPDGDYELKLYRTWAGRYLGGERGRRRTTMIPSRDGRLTVTIPELQTTGGHASHIGHDVAFKLTPSTPKVTP